MELLIVLAIAAAIVTVVLPRFSSVLTAVELKSSARQLASALRYARSQAIAQRRDVALTLNVQERTYQTSGVNKINTLPSDLNMKLFTAKRELLNDETGAIRFFPDGSATGGQITLSASGHAYVVDVKWLTGRITIHE